MHDQDLRRPNAAHLAVPADDGRDAILPCEAEGGGVGRCSSSSSSSSSRAARRACLSRHGGVHSVLFISGKCVCVCVCQCVWAVCCSGGWMDEVVGDIGCWMMRTHDDDDPHKTIPNQSKPPPTPPPTNPPPQTLTSPPHAPNQRQLHRRTPTLDGEEGPC
jgi:hypothetical protein